jgi:regulatory protein
MQAQAASEADPAAAIERLALKLLAIREHARRELARKLAARGFAEEDVDAALDRLAADGSIDDARLAEHYVAERMGKGFGPLRIRGELREKGLEDDLIERALEPLRDEWPACLADACDRRFGAEPPVDHAEYGRRARFLEQRGFPTDSIRRFLRWPD